MSAGGLEKRRLRPSQIVLGASAAVIYAMLIALLLWSYVAIDENTSQFGTAAQINSIFSTTQRESLVLIDEIEHAGDPEGLDRARIRLGLLQRQAHTLDIATQTSQSAFYQEMSDVVANNVRIVQEAFDSAGQDPMDEELRERTADSLRASEPTMKKLYDQSERELFDRVRSSLAARQTAERGMLGLAVVMVALAAVLVASLRRGVRSDFDLAYEALALEGEERSAAEAKLRASEHHFRALVHNASDVFTVIDSENRISYQSPAVERGLGHQPDELVGTPFLDLVDEADHDHAIEAVRAARDPNAETITSMLRLRSASGQALTFEVALSRLDNIDAGAPSDQMLVLNYRDISERLRYEEQLARQAFEDSLTGIANRAMFAKRLDDALSETPETSVAVLYLDLDRFKIVNDSLGHDAGDELLRQVARRLSQCVGRGDQGSRQRSETSRAADILARLGGDEFTVLLTGIDDPDGPRLVADRIVNSLQQPFQIAGHDVVITSSVGIAIGRSGQVTADGLMRDADAAMYHAKSNGKNRFETFEPAMHERAVERLLLETDLRAALDEHQLQLAYQPIFDLATGQATAAEALVRWQHPRRGAISPAEFIPLAEETGLIVPIGRWVIEEACRQTADWRRNGLADLSINVNLSVLQFDDPDLIDHVRRTLDITGLPATALCIEVTETLFMDNMDHAVEILIGLRDLGVRTAVDDFGEGHSSLRYLRDLPIDVVKVDRSFVAELDTNDASVAIFEAILTLGDALDLVIAAEGIETEEQLATLVRLGCPNGQGFLLARPMPPDEIVARLTSALADAGALAR